ncbi:hypothetical protein SGQ44_10690 [Flavobacterium sp. Fl-77]|uniref:Uncharacterized protein n=1 Tax=Flavobacterium flavipigmentatum TaxID=2893884 RepID=A0AAJ2S7X4_9FLAO|nr:MULTISPECIES: hypothetical protein [unclassified Flavobacterium]MDX6182592.1 hypothetical protein [Flavobacterium sp. Fl-33]MDX6186228.1 hypothetical protein [Flavobacterium sp. Fl-77]UFH38375.1 hypothetical protein LNP22_16780 [Flavobacterium sp. F-70]
MSESRILVGGHAIRIDNLEKRFYNLQGFLTEFTIIASQKKYVHVDSFEFSGFGEKHYKGYVLESELLKYYANEIVINELTKHVLLKENIKSAQKDDIVKVSFLNVDSNTDVFYKLERKSFLFNQNLKLLDEKGNIKFPTSGVTSALEDVSAVQNQTAKDFFTNKFPILASFVDNDVRKSAHYILVKIGLKIAEIEREIFSKFDESSDGDIYNYITKQRNVWTTKDIFGEPSIQKLNNYYDSISLFQEAAYKNTLKLQNAVPAKRLYILALCLDAESLTIMNYEEKIKLLTYLNKETLSATFEQEEDERLVLSICASFDLTNSDQIDLFLDKLILTKPYSDSDFTLYQCLYSKMSTSTKMFEGVISLVNYVVNTDFKPTTTKAYFVNNIYALWILSKYNPFNDEGSYKANTIGLISQYSDLVEIETYVDTSNYLFKYTNYYASDPIFENGEVEGVSYTILKGYKETRPDAAPIVMPYYNQKMSTAFGEKYLVLDPYVTNFELSFSGEFIKAEQKCTQWRRYENISTPDPHDYIYNTNLAAGSINVPFGTYKIYQPVTLTNFNFESRQYYSFSTGEDITVNATKINTLIPMFVLQFIHEDTGRSNAEDIIGFSVDVASTATGIGSLQKLKHLRWAATGTAEIGLFTIDGIRIFIGGVEFSSGVLSFLGNFVECSTNDAICNGVKGFLNYLQLACLAFNTTDGLASNMAKFKAKKLIDSANEIGTNNNSLDNLTEVLGGTAEANTAAITILEFADETSNSERINKIADRVLKLFQDKVNFKYNVGKFKLDQYSIQAIREIVEHLSTKVNTVAIESIFDNLCKDFIFTGSRKGADNLKLISKEQLIKRINFFYDVVQVRGFTSGFNSLSHFKGFCTKTRTFFSNNFRFWNDNDLDDIVAVFPSFADHIDDYWMSAKFDFKKRIRLVVQGSANTKHNTGEPHVGLLAEDLPDGIPGDFEFALIFKDKDFQVLGKLFKKKHKGFNEITYIEKGFLISEAKDGINLEDILDKSFIKNFRNAISDDINFASKKVKFAIVKEGSKYDTQPYTDFKFND